MIEPLEHRRLMRGGVVRVEGDTLYVSGTAGDDVIEISGRQKRVVVTLNGREQTFRTVLRHAEIFCGRGDDTLTIGKPKRRDTLEGFLRLNAFADGGGGNDSLTSGDSDDTLLGGTGDDTLRGDLYYAYNGRDYLDGGPGDDDLRFGRTMYGGSGDDTATATYANQTFTGGLETYRYDDLEHTTDTLPVDRPNLFRKNGKLVFTFETDGYEQESAARPYTLADGRFAVVVHRVNTYPPDGIDIRTVTFAFNPGEAGRHGIVVRFTEPGNRRIDESLDQTVLIAGR